MTENLKRFLAANAVYPIVSGSVIGPGGQGVRYQLADGRVFTLTAEECDMTVVPRWQDA